MKGFVLTADVAVSVAIASIVVLTAVQIGSVGAFPELEARRIAADAVAVLDYGGVLATYDKAKIEGNLSSVLPSNLNMSMEITRFNSTGLVSRMQVNANITKDYVQGKWWYATDKGQFFHLVEYRVSFK